MNTPRVLVTVPFLPKHILDLLETRFKVIVAEHDTKESAEKVVAGVDAILCTTTWNLDKEFLNLAGPQLGIISTISMGYDHIDVDELRKRRIKLLNVARATDDAVADVAVLLTLGAARGIRHGRLVMESGRRDFTSISVDIKGSTVGIVGFGGIGQAILERLKVFKVAKFLYTGHSEKEEGRKLGAEFVDLDTLVSESDFVILSCPLTPETRFLFNAEMFSKMKPDSVLVNVARGEIVDQDAMVDALRNKKIWGVGLDVTTPEPLPSDHELLKLPNAVLMPHWGWATRKTFMDMVETSANNLLRCLDGDEMIKNLSQ